MQSEPQVPYIYQPQPAFGASPPREQRIWAIGGPGSEKLQGKRFTYAEAQRALDDLVLSRVGMLTSFLPRGF